MKPLLFISHSARENVAAGEALATLTTGLENDWDVFVDRERLTAGERWRDHIHTALAVCDAAVILFSKGAYDDSEWVLKEATIFGWRQALDKSFKLICALFPEVKPEMLSTGKYKAVFLGELLWVDVTKPDFVARVKTALGPPQQRAPGQRIVRAIAHRFRNVPEGDLQAAAAQLGRTLEWSPAVDRRERFARDLLHADLDAVRGALREIVTYMTADEINEINHFLAPFAVNPLAVSKIPKVALSEEAGCKRVFAVNATKSLIGEQYVQRARCHPDAWTVVTLANAGGHDTRGSLKRELLDSIRDQVPELGTTEEEIADMLDSSLGDGTPLFVVVHGPVDKTAIDWLRNDFPACTFLVLAGENADDEGAASAGVELLTPTLEPGRETVIERHYNKVRLIAENRKRQRS